MIFTKVFLTIYITIYYNEYLIKLFLLVLENNNEDYFLISRFKSEFYEIRTKILNISLKNNYSQ